MRPLREGCEGFCALQRGVCGAQGMDSEGMWGSGWLLMCLVLHMVVSSDGRSLSANHSILGRETADIDQMMESVEEQSIHSVRDKIKDICILYILRILIPSSLYHLRGW